MINLNELLEPISPEQPCGESLIYDAEYLALESLLKGKPETQYSPAEEPKWSDVRDRSVALLRRSKDLRLMLILTLAWLKTDELKGFRAGLALLRSSLENYWETLHPRLDPSDGNDPAERVNILAALSPAESAFADVDAMHFTRRLREVPLAQSTLHGRFSLADAAAAQLPPVEGNPRIDPAIIETAFRETPGEFLAQEAADIEECKMSVQAIDAFLVSTIGAGRALEVSALMKVLVDLAKYLAPYLTTPANPDAPSFDGAVSSPAGSARPPTVSGSIGTRADVVQTLERICEYYRQHEPSSPVPLLLARAQRMAQMNFLEIVAELTPEALAELQKVTGVKPV